MTRDKREKHESKITVLELLPGPAPKNDLPWWAIGLRVLGVVLLGVYCVLAWVSITAVYWLGPVWGLAGVLVSGPFCILGVMLIDGRFDP